MRTTGSACDVGSTGVTTPNLGRGGEGRVRRWCAPLRALLRRTLAGEAVRDALLYIRRGDLVPHVVGDVRGGRPFARRIRRFLDQWSCR